MWKYCTFNTNKQRGCGCNDVGIKWWSNIEKNCMFFTLSMFLKVWATQLVELQLSMWICMFSLWPLGFHLDAPVSSGHPVTPVDWTQMTRKLITHIDLQFWGGHIMKYECSTLNCKKCKWMLLYIKSLFLFLNSEKGTDEKMGVTAPVVVWQSAKKQVSGKCWRWKIGPGSCEENCHFQMLRRQRNYVFGGGISLELV